MQSKQERLLVALAALQLCVKDNFGGEIGEMIIEPFDALENGVIEHNLRLSGASICRMDFEDSVSLSEGRNESRPRLHSVFQSERVQANP